MTYVTIKDSGESTSHTFVIRIWSEDQAEGLDRSKWHGRITHMPSGAINHFGTLNEISDFISPYLQSQGVRPTIRERVTRWAQQLRGHSSANQTR
jgi:hypothetical protein